MLWTIIVHQEKALQIPHLSDIPILRIKSEIGLTNTHFELKVGGMAPYVFLAMTKSVYLTHCIIFYTGSHVAQMEC